MKRLTNLLLAAICVITAILYSGCLKDNGSNTNHPDVTAVADTIFGTLKYNQKADGVNNVVDWPYGNATFKVIVETSDVLTSATVNADGTFMLIMPAKISGNYLSSLADAAYMQGGSVESTPNSVRFMNTLLYKVEYTDNAVAKSITTNLYTLKPDFSIDKSYFYNFYDSEGTFTGTASSGNIFNWTFTKGWGKVESYIINSSSDAFNSKSIGSFPENAVWVNM
jgi:hypothetical protein